jgi:putative transposase
MNWKEFIGMHMGVLFVTAFFTPGVWTWCRLVACDVLFFVRIATREVHIAGVTPHPDKRWMRLIASNVTMAE